MVLGHRVEAARMHGENDQKMLGEPVFDVDDGFECNVD
jgi:hypothetical protein